MSIGLSFLLGILLSIWLLAAFLLEYINTKGLTKAKKEIHVEKRQCEVCSSVYFVSVSFDFWHCPLCGSINKEK